MAEKQKEVGVLWSKTSNKGMSFMSGTIEIEGKKVEVVAFLNSNKKNPKEPDWRLYESRPREQQENALPQRETEAVDPAVEPIDGDSIPF